MTSTSISLAIASRNSSALCQPTLVMATTYKLALRSLARSCFTASSSLSCRPRRTSGARTMAMSLTVVGSGRALEVTASAPRLAWKGWCTNRQLDQSIQKRC